MQMTVHITNLDRTEERLSALGASLTDFQEALTGLGESLKLFYGDTVFGSQGQALGHAWTPLSATYDQWKAKHYPGRGILEQTGTMRKSFYAKATPMTLFVGNSDVKFPWHQLGTGYGGGATFGIGNGGGARIGRGRNLPARPMIGVNSKVESMVVSAIEADVKAKIASTNI